MHLPLGSIVVSGPVIIENGRVLLNRERKNADTGPWVFPGGEVEDFDKSLEEACAREAKEEMGIDIKIIRPLRPLLIHTKEKVIVLIHFLTERTGEIVPGPDTAEWGWHDVYNLPTDCAPNVHTIINDYISSL